MLDIPSTLVWQDVLLFKIVLVMVRGVKNKLRPRFIGAFEILRRVGEVAYELALPPRLSSIYSILIFFAPLVHFV